jgi:hypothetical protein
VSSVETSETDGQNAPKRDAIAYYPGQETEVALSGSADGFFFGVAMIAGALFFENDGPFDRRFGKHPCETEGH